VLSGKQYGNGAASATPSSRAVTIQTETLPLAGFPRPLRPCLPARDRSWIPRFAYSENGSQLSPHN
jgi:hypothetical protein